VRARQSKVVESSPAIVRATRKVGREQAAKAFEADYGAKWPKATAKITEHLDVLLAFYDYPPSTGSTCARPTRSSRPSPP
jgi:transposase-like protein